MDTNIYWIKRDNIFVDLRLMVDASKKCNDDRLNGTQGRREFVRWKNRDERRSIHLRAAG